ncbi:trans-2-enoyl-CoA reductase family protein [Paenibacillus sp. BR2-3]|uniref:enoyl-ACP reductase FabV n=1 Tax=Paenibacillus sp. BR2-3 TaxID=3048494 RepID=UPI0039776DAB
MIIHPKTRSFICTTAHPEGCAKQIEKQIEFVKAQKKFEGPANVLVIGASTGYGLASRIAAAFGAGANTIGVFFDRPAESTRTATAGWYNTAAFEQEAAQHGLKSFSIVGDAFSDGIKAKTIELIKAEFGTVDLVVYSLASPRRTHPVTGETFSSVIKPIGPAYTNKTLNFHTGEVSLTSIEPANEEEIRQTVAVMGGEDWRLWIQQLSEAGVLAHGVTTVAYSYVGPKVTQPIYREGTIGKAKNDLEQTAGQLNELLDSQGGRAYVSVNKALVTQSSSAIPVVPLYISALYKVMKEKGLHENCIEQMYRLFSERLYGEGETAVDEKGLIRIDDWEMREDVQSEVMKRWLDLDTDNVTSLADLAGYQEDFFQLFGFQTEGVDYDADVEPEVDIPNLY